MTMTGDEILEQMRALPFRQRLRLVARIVHEVAESVEVDEAEMNRELERGIHRTVAGGPTVPAEDVIAKLRARG